MSSGDPPPSTGEGGGGGSSGYFHGSFNNFGLGYTIAVALGFLVLFCTIIISTYVCFRSRSRRGGGRPNPAVSDHSNTDGIILPRIIFVAEEDDGSRDEESVVGLDQTVINSYPKFPFRKSKDCASVGDSMCSICLCDYKEEEMLRMMPDCRHFFHLYCIDAWLKLNASCPVCRNSPMPTPLSTPLSELVPLSQYPADRRR